MSNKEDRGGKNGVRYTILAALTGLTALVTAAGLATLRGQKRLPPVDAVKETPPTPGEEWPTVSVIVPARNEERTLPRLLPTLLKQRYPKYEIIVVDDASTDSTPDVLRGWQERDGRVGVVNGSPLPDGWRGKPWAMTQGAKAAKGEWLLFTDADTNHSQLSVSSSMAFALEHEVDLMTILPHAELVTPAERVIMPIAFMGIANLYPPHRVNDPKSKVAIANGQYILIRREVYDAVGGIESVKDKIAEDLEFARVVKGAGYRLYLADGRHLMSVRMYTNLAEIWEGWGKNVVLSFRGKPALAALTISSILTVSLLPAALVRWTRVLRKTYLEDKGVGTKVPLLWAAALAGWHTAFPFVYRRAMDRTMGLPFGWTLTQPLGIMAMLAIMVHSLVRLLTGKGVTWKGRRYTS